MDQGHDYSYNNEYLEWVRTSGEYGVLRGSAAVVASYFLEMIDEYIAFPQSFTAGIGVGKHTLIQDQHHLAGIKRLLSHQDAPGVRYEEVPEAMLNLYSMLQVTQPFMSDQPEQWSCRSNGEWRVVTISRRDLGASLIANLEQELESKGIDAEKYKHWMLKQKDALGRNIYHEVTFEQPVVKDGGFETDIHGHVEAKETEVVLPRWMEAVARRFVEDRVNKLFPSRQLGEEDFAPKRKRHEPAAERLQDEIPESWEEEAGQPRRDSRSR